MSVLQDLIGAVVAAALMGLFAGIAWITGFTMIGQEVSDQLRGRVFAFVMSSVRVVLLGTIAVGPVLAGLIGSHSLVIGGFEWPFSGAAVVLAIGGLAAIAVSTIAGHQIGGLASALLRRLLGRRSTWYEPDDHSGVLIAVEGMHGDQVATLALAVNDELHRQGWRTESERFDAHLRQPVGLETPAGALRAITDLAEFTAERLRPALQAGAVVVCEGYVDAVVVRFMSLDGQPEERMWRAAQWAVGGLRPDLIVLIDPRASVVAAEPDESAIDGAAVTPIESPGPPAPVSAADAVRLEVPVGPDEDDPDHHVDPAQAYLDRASYTPERYLVVAPIAEPSADLLSGELRERIGSVLRQRSPVLAESQRTG
jgi:dTMP kinase